MFKGEDGLNPSRLRHCVRGANRTEATASKEWEGIGELGSVSQETRRGREVPTLR